MSINKQSTNTAKIAFYRYVIARSPKGTYARAAAKANLKHLKRESTKNEND